MRVAELLSDLTTLRPEVCVRHSNPRHFPYNTIYTRRPTRTPKLTATPIQTPQDQKAALALVTTRPENTTSTTSTPTTTSNDPDLKRAQDLLELHSDVKLAHADGTDRELIEAREAVRRVLVDL